MSQEEIVALLESYQNLSARFDKTQLQLDWLKRQLFGAKSERHLVSEVSRQLTLGEIPPADPQIQATVEIPAHKRGCKLGADSDGDGDGDLRFDESVPVERIVLPAPIVVAERDQYEQIGEKTTRKLAQRPGSYVILEYVRPVLKKKAAADAIADEIVCAAAPTVVLDRSFADVSLLAGILIDKFLFHLPLYRQHQRMAAGVWGMNRPRASRYTLSPRPTRAANFS